jgi:hypothetical protein
MELPNTHEEPKTDLNFNNDGTATYELNMDGDISGSYRGKFIFRCYLDPLSELAASRLFREIMGVNSQEMPETEKYLAWALAQLKYRIVKAPPFWRTENSIVDGNIFDKNVIMHVLDMATEAELLYRKNLKKKKEEALEKAQQAVQALHESLNP